MGCGTSQLLDDVQFKARFPHTRQSHPTVTMSAAGDPLPVSGISRRLPTETSDSLVCGTVTVQVSREPLSLKDRIGRIENEWQQLAPGEMDGIGREVLMGFFRRLVATLFAVPPFLDCPFLARGGRSRRRHGHWQALGPRAWPPHTSGQMLCRA